MPRLKIWTLAALVPFAALAQETILLRDGTSFDGRMTGATERSITFRDNSGQMHRFDVDRVQSIQFAGPNGAGSYGGNNPGNNNAGAPVPPPADNQHGAYSAKTGAGRNAIDVPAGTEIAVRTNESIDARDTSQGTSYAAQVDRDVVDTAGNIIIPRGSEARLVVRQVKDHTLGLGPSVGPGEWTYLQRRYIDYSRERRCARRTGRQQKNRRICRWRRGARNLIGRHCWRWQRRSHRRIGRRGRGGRNPGTYSWRSREGSGRIRAEFRLDSPLRMRAA